MAQNSQVSDVTDVTAYYADFVPDRDGHDDAELGSPAASAVMSTYAELVRERKEKHFEELKHRHAETEAQLAAEYSEIHPKFITARNAYLQKKEQLGGREVDRMFSHKLAIGLTIFFVALCGIVDAYEFSHADWELPFAIVFGLIMASIMGAGSYLSGLLFRQSKNRFGFVVATVIFVMATASTIAVVSSFDQASLGLSMRLALTSLELVAMFAVCALAYFSHDPDPSYPVLWKKYDTLYARLTSVVNKRKGNQKHFHGIATVSKNYAEELIQKYRLFKQRNRNNTPISEHTKQEPGFPDIDAADFPFQTSNIILEEDIHGVAI